MCVTLSLPVRLSVNVKAYSFTEVDLPSKRIGGVEVYRRSTSSNIGLLHPSMDFDHRVICQMGTHYLGSLSHSANSFLLLDPLY